MIIDASILMCGKVELRYNLYSPDLILMDDLRVSPKYSQLPPNIAKFGDSGDPWIIAARGQVLSVLFMIGG